MTTDCQQVQAATLARILSLNAGSRFSTERNLTDRLSPEQFRRQVPIGNFETVRRYVEELKAGDTAALLGPHNPLLMFALSSGTTNESKFVPITRPFLEDYRRGWQIWGIEAFDSHPELNRLDIVQLSSDYDQFRTTAGTPCGNISGLVSSMQSRIVRSMYTVPLGIAKIADAETKYYAALRLAMANPHVGLVMTANPSTLVSWAKLAATHSERLIRDIHDGTLTPPVDPYQSGLTALRYNLRQNRSRAAELATILKETGTLAPKDFWPSLNLIGVWSGGSAGFYLPQMRQAFGSVPIRDHGLSASEGRMTIPLADETAGGVLDIGTHYFEFVPEEEYGTNHPTVLGAHELVARRNYYILLTTCSGLYRYDICDVVRCTGFFNSTPLLEFLHKGAHISNLTGEKLSESQVVDAVQRASSANSINIPHFTLAPVWGNPPYYAFHVECDFGAGSELAQSLTTSLDDHLCSANSEYRDKRASGRLAQIEMKWLPPGTWSQFARQRQSRLGGSVEQYKHPCLVPDLGFSERLVQMTRLAATAQERAA